MVKGRGKKMFFLLIERTKDEHWRNKLTEALAKLGELHVTKVEEAMNQILDEKYKVVMVDATGEDEVEKVVSRLRTQRPDCRIVVMTASPTWQRARAAFEAGAIDYLPKTLGAEELAQTFEQIRNKPLPPWPR
jgi:DNA-binding NtrC family response regulator